MTHRWSFKELFDFGELIKKTRLPDQSKVVFSDSAQSSCLNLRLKQSNGVDCHRKKDRLILNATDSCPTHMPQRQPATRHPPGQVAAPQWCLRNPRAEAQLSHAYNSSACHFPSCSFAWEVRFYFLFTVLGGPHPWRLAQAQAGLSHARDRSAAPPGAGWWTRRHPPPFCGMCVWHVRWASVADYTDGSH